MMWLGAVLFMGGACISPFVPWLLLPSRRTAGAVTAGAWGVLAIPWFFVGLGEYGPFAAATIVSSTVRILVEVLGVLEPRRAARQLKKQRPQQR
jgi:hypothetical protein